MVPLWKKTIPSYCFSDFHVWEAFAVNVSQIFGISQLYKSKVFLERAFLKVLQHKCLKTNCHLHTFPGLGCLLSDKPDYFSFDKATTAKSFIPSE